MKIAITIGLGKTQFQINQAYIEYVAKAGYEPVIVTPLNDVTLMANDCDALLLPGGIDIDPMYYGEDNDNCHGTDLEKDEFERSMFMAFIEVRKPIFGICRGFQLMARETLQHEDKLQFIQNIPSHAQSNISIPRSQTSHFIKANTKVLYNDNTVLPRRIPVNSMHHQALVGSPGKKRVIGSVELLAVTSRGLSDTSVEDGYVVIEAADFHAWDNVKIRGVQWHPEETMDVALLHNFFGQNEQEQGV